MAGEPRPFGDLFAEAPRNGLTRPKAIRGSGVKMVNMGELFAYPRLSNAPMDSVPLSESESGRFLLKPRDLLFARQSLVLEGAGKCSIFLGDDEPVTFESHITRVRLDQTKADPVFYFYYLQSHHGHAAIRSIVEQGAGASGIRGSDLGTLDVLWLPIAEQRAIAPILGTLDDKIELNRRHNATLEEMARALFKAWFVDFEPVRAKREGRWHRGQSLPGLPAHLYDLFPDRLVDSSLGEIPEGWSIGKFGQIVRQLKEPVNPGESPEAMFAHYSLPAFDDSQSPVIETGEAIKSNKWRVEPGAVLLSKLNPEIDRTWLVDVRGDAQAVCSTEFLVLTTRKPYTRSFLYSLARSDAFRQQLESLVTGTSKSHQRAQPTAVMDMDVVLPSEAAVAAFEHLASGWLTQTQANRRESRTLATLRDTLLPKLISGELRIADAKRFIEART